MGDRYLVDRDPGAPQPRWGGMTLSGLPVKELGFVWVAVTVLGEQDPTGSHNDHGVTHSPP